MFTQSLYFIWSLLLRNIFHSPSFCYFNFNILLFRLNSDKTHTQWLTLIEEPMDLLRLSNPEHTPGVSQVFFVLGCVCKFESFAVSLVPSSDFESLCSSKHKFVHCVSSFSDFWRERIHIFVCYIIYCIMCNVGKCILTTVFTRI